MRKILVFFWYKYCSMFFRMFPVKNNRILFSSFFGKGYGDSPKYIAEELLKTHKKYELIWLVNKKEYEGFPKSIKQVKRGTIKELYYLSTSKIWIDNCRKHYGIKKRQNQFYIQTWHSSLRLKKIEKDAEDCLSSDYIKSAKSDSKMINIITCGCDFSYNTYNNSFWYDGDIIMTGTPKFDIYFDRNIKKKIKDELSKKFNINPTKKIILYAPTFRNNDANFIGNIDLNSFSELLKKIGYVLLIRLHPNCKSKINSSDNLINVTDYPNIQDLIIFCDLLITDYSGCCFDALVAKKPCILFVPDLEEYLKKERKLYFSYNELPFKKIYKSEDLYNYVKQGNMNDVLNKYEVFSKKIGLKEDGQASKKITKIIEGVINNEKI